MYRWVSGVSGGTCEVSTPKHVEYLMACISFSAQLDGELFSEKLANESLFNYWVREKGTLIWSDHVLLCQQGLHSF